jgi:hypothetical protein
MQIKKGNATLEDKRFKKQIVIDEPIIEFKKSGIIKQYIFILIIVLQSRSLAITMQFYG